MARPVEPLVVGRVIGDVLDMFVPAAELIVQYGSKQVGNGCEIKPSHSAHKPAVRVNGSRGRAASLFTLVSVPSHTCSLVYTHIQVHKLKERKRKKKKFLNFSNY